RVRSRPRSPPWSLGAAPPVSVALFFRKVLNATTSHPPGAVGRQVCLAGGHPGALDGVLGQLDAAADHPLPLAEVPLVRAASRVLLVPVGRPLEHARAHAVEAQVALPGVLQVLRAPGIGPAR